MNKTIPSIIESVLEWNEKRAKEWEKDIVYKGKIYGNRAFRDGAAAGHRWSNDKLSEIIPTLTSAIEEVCNYVIGFENGVNDMIGDAIIKEQRKKLKILLDNHNTII